MGTAQETDQRGTLAKESREITKDKQEQCRLLHFTQIVNAKSYYRKYAGLIDRVKKTMADNGVIAEIREYETDAHGNEKKGKKTPFVTTRQDQVEGRNYGEREQQPRAELTEGSSAKGRPRRQSANGDE